MPVLPFPPPDHPLCGDRRGRRADGGEHRGDAAVGLPGQVFEVQHHGMRVSRGMGTMCSAQSSPRRRRRIVASKIRFLSGTPRPLRKASRATTMTCNCTMSSCPCTKGEKCDVRVRWPTPGRSAHQPLPRACAHGALLRRKLHSSSRAAPRRQPSSLSHSVAASARRLWWSTAAR